MLFIGNSLTLANDLPRMVERLSAASGTPISATVVAFEGFSRSPKPIWPQLARRTGA